MRLLEVSYQCARFWTSLTDLFFNLHWGALEKSIAYWKQNMWSDTFLFLTPLSLSLLPAVNHCFSFNRNSTTKLKPQFNYNNIYFPDLPRQHLFGHDIMSWSIPPSGIIIYLSCLFRLWAPREYMLLWSVGPSESPEIVRSLINEVNQHFPWKHGDWISVNFSVFD